MTNSQDVKIYSFYYKPGKIIIPDPVYQPLMAGNALQSGNQFIPGDDSGENISAKNPWYSELTGIYWVWKNTSHKVTGTCHYRRFLTAKPEPFLYRIKRLFYYPAGLYKKRFGLIYTNNADFFVSRILKSNEINELLTQYDAILPQARKLKYTVETHYHRYHDRNDLILLKSIIAERHPGYIQAFELVMAGKRLYANNMFILKNEHFQEFMSWWFDILFEFEHRIELKNYTDYQKRILGFIAERLLTVWFRHKKLKCAELPVIYFKRLKFE
jgi:hypothetical protein